MNRLRAILTANRIYLLTYFFFFLVGLYLLLDEGKAASFFSLNPYHSTGLDAFFVRFTLLGDGIFALSVFIFLLILRRFSQAWQLLVAFLGSALFAQLLKSWFSMPRPKQFFAPGQYAYFIHGVTHIGFSSFPSGHSTTIFTLATMLALFERNKRWNVCYLLVAVAVGYSRIYLGQHFLGDVLMGSVLGILLSVLVHWLFTRKTGGVRAAGGGPE
jgi:membrane-associated phospholipid phosphatase